MIIRFAILFLLATQLCQAASPKLFGEKSFDAASLAEAVNHFIALGETNAVNELNALASDNIYNPNLGFSINERIGWVCRVLFEPKEGKPLRPPMYGALSQLPRNTMPDKNWPLYPVAISGSTYFVLSEGYSLGGEAEKPKDYIAYCQMNGIFRKALIKIPTKEQALKDAASLRKSEAWIAIKWQDSGLGFSYTLNEESSWEFIQNQAESIR
jgi:hypothetical protein